MTRDKESRLEKIYEDFMVIIKKFICSFNRI